MQPDLIGLGISKGELRCLTGFDPEDVFRPSTMANREKRMGFFFNEGLALALTPIIIGFIYAFIILPTLGSSNKLGVILLIIVIVAVVVGRSLWRKNLSPCINNPPRRS